MVTDLLALLDSPSLEYLAVMVMLLVLLTELVLSSPSEMDARSELSDQEALVVTVLREPSLKVAVAV
jgi:hypothetical protein